MKMIYSAEEKYVSLLLLLLLLVILETYTYIYIYIFFFLTLVFVAVCLICHFSFDAISVCVFVCVCVYLCLFVCSLAQRFFSKWVFDIATPCFASSNPRVLHKSASFVLSFSQVIISGSHI